MLTPPAAPGACCAAQHLRAVLDGLLVHFLRVLELLLQGEDLAEVEVDDVLGRLGQALPEEGLGGVVVAHVHVAEPDVVQDVPVAPRNGHRLLVHLHRRGVLAQQVQRLGNLLDVLRVARVESCGHLEHVERLLDVPCGKRTAEFRARGGEVRRRPRPRSPAGARQAKAQASAADASCSPSCRSMRPLT